VVVKKVDIRFAVSGNPKTFLNQLSTAIARANKMIAELPKAHLSAQKKIAEIEEKGQARREKNRTQDIRAEAAATNARVALAKAEEREKAFIANQAAAARIKANAVTTAAFKKDLRVVQEQVAGRVREFGVLSDHVNKSTLSFRSFKKAIAGVEDNVILSGLASRNLEGLKLSTLQASKVTTQFMGEMKLLNTAMMAHNKTSLTHNAILEQKIIYQRALSKSLVNVGKNLQWQGRQLSMGLTLPLLIATTALSMHALSVDREITRVLKVYNGYGENLDDVATRVREFSHETASSLGMLQTESIGVVAAFAQMGKTGDELFNLARETQRIARLGEIDMETATELVRTTSTIFKKEGQDLVDTLNRFNMIENETALSLGELAEGFPIVATVANELGMSAEQTAASLAILREAGVQARIGATALRTALSRITDPTDQAREAFNEFGVDIDEIFVRNGNNAFQVLLELSDIAAKMGDQKPEIIKAFGELVGVRQSPRLIQLLNGLQEISTQGQAAQRAFDAVGVSAEMAAAGAAEEIDRWQNSLSGTVDTIKAELLVEIEKMGQTVAPIFKASIQLAFALTKAINTVGGAIADFLNFLGPFGDIIKNIAVVGLGIGAAVGPIIMISGLLANFFGSIGGGVVTLKERILGVTGSIQQWMQSVLGLNNTLIGHRSTVDQLVNSSNKLVFKYEQLAGVNDYIADQMRDYTSAAAQQTGVIREQNQALERQAEVKRNIAKRNTMLITAFTSTAFAIHGITYALGRLNDENASFMDRAVSMTFAITEIVFAIRSWKSATDALRISQIAQSAASSSGILAASAAAGARLGISPLATGAGVLGSGFSGAAVFGGAAAALGGIAALSAGIYATWRLIDDRVEDTYEFADRLGDALGLAKRESAEIADEFKGIGLEADTKDPFSDFTLIRQMSNFLNNVENLDIGLLTIARSLAARGATSEELARTFERLDELLTIDIPSGFKNATELVELMESPSEILTNEFEKLRDTIDDIKDGLANIPWGRISRDASTIGQAIGQGLISGDTESQKMAMQELIALSASLEGDIGGREVRIALREELVKALGSIDLSLSARAVGMSLEEVIVFAIEELDISPGGLISTKFSRAMTGAFYAANVGRAFGNELLRQLPREVSSVMSRVIGSLRGPLDRLINFFSMSGASAGTGFAVGFGHGVGRMTADQGRQIATDFIGNIRSGINDDIAAVGNLINEAFDSRRDAISDNFKDQREDMQDQYDIEKEELSNRYDVELEALEDVYGLNEKINRAKEREFQREQIRRNLRNAEISGEIEIAAAIARGDLGAAASARQALISQRQKAADDLRKLDQEETDERNKENFDIAKASLDERFELEEDNLQKKYDLMEDELAAAEEHAQKLIDIEQAAQEEILKTFEDRIVDSNGAMARLVSDMARELNLTPDQIREVTRTYDELVNSAAMTLGADQEWENAIQNMMDKIGSGLEGGLNSIAEVLIHWATTGEVLDVASIISNRLPNEPESTAGLTQGTGHRMHSGGYINGRGMPMKGLAADEHAAILQQGEYVIQREAVDKLGVGYLNSINKYHDGGIISAVGNKMINALIPSLGNQIKEYGSIAPFLSGAIGGLIAPDGARMGQAWINNMNPAVVQLVSSILSQIPGGQTIVSAYRSPEHNRAVGGVRYSDHLTGHAVDIVGNKGADFDQLMDISSYFEPMLGKQVRWIGNPVVDPSGHDDHVHVSFMKDLMQMKKGGMVMKDNTLANLHKGEAVLRTPLPQMLIDGIKNMNGGGSTTVYVNVGEFHGSEENIDKLATVIAKKITKANSRRSGSRRIG
jgi:TP901 family phage tail tape measure protein